MHYRHLAALGCMAGTALSAALPGTAVAEESDAARDSRFRLGEIIVTGQRAGDVAIGASTLSTEAMRAFNRTSLDDAAQLIPGVAVAASGNSRNERVLTVRGFDRYQVPLSIDGIRVYLPADGRLDHARFLTADIAEIQVAKGYASVLDGPGAMGGAVNLVTRKPTRALEVEGRATLNLDNDADYAGYTAFGLLGTKQDRWYAQASYTRSFTDHWDLSGAFTPTAYENGGERDLTRSHDWRVNAKIGFTPNATDEYAFSYVRQEGAKHAPRHVSDTSNRSNRYWDWPYWNIQNIYFLSTTRLSDIATLKTKAYYNQFRNGLDSYDDATLTTQNTSNAFNSGYDDRAYGGSLQLELVRAAGDRLSVAFHYRNDQHKEYQQLFPSGFVEPWQTSREESYSAAIENSLTLAPALELVLGFSYDWRQLRRAEDYYTDGRSFVYYPIRNSDAWNAQGALRWAPDEDSDLCLSISSRTRFPTLADRFSSRFGMAIANPDLKAERATQVELGGSRRYGPLRAEGAVWYSRVNDAIMAITIAPSTTINRNLGNGDYYGAELSLTATVSSGLSLGGNYSWVKRELTDPSVAAFRPTGVPTHKAFLYADWSPLAGLRIMPNVDIASDRWVVTPAGAYYRTGDYALANLSIEYALTAAIDVSVGGRNLFDVNHATADGYPEPGRSLFLSLRARY